VVIQEHRVWRSRTRQFRQLITPLESPTTEVLLGEQGHSNLNQVVSEAQKLISYADPTIARRVAAPAYAEHTSGSSRTEGGIF
jgi:hypothetical protein